MEIKEKIKKYYLKHGIGIDEDYVEGILNDPERVKALMRLYKQEEIETMNYIYGKPKNNNYFTEQELKEISKIDLFDKKLVEWIKLIQQNRNNEENLKEILEALEERRCPKCI